MRQGRRSSRGGRPGPQGGGLGLLFPASPGDPAELTLLSRAGSATEQLEQAGPLRGLGLADGEGRASGPGPMDV